MVCLLKGQPSWNERDRLVVVEVRAKSKRNATNKQKTATTKCNDTAVFGGCGNRLGQVCNLSVGVVDVCTLFSG